MIFPKIVSLPEWRFLPTFEKNGGHEKIMVTIPYMSGALEAVEQTLRRHGIGTAVRLYKTLCQLLVHQKDKRSVPESAGVVYSIPCRDCPIVYIGETGRRFEMRQKEHKKDLKQLEGVKYTRARRKESITDIHQSALMDHIDRKNHTIDREGVRLPAKEPDWKKRRVKDAIFIRKRRLARTKGPVWSQNILASKNVLPNSPYP